MVEFITGKTPVNLLTALIILDTVLGIGKAVTLNELNSRKLTNGVIKNGSLMLTVWVLYLYLPENFDLPATTVIYALTLGQIVSVFENLGLMGVKLPAQLEGILKQLNNKNGKGE